MNGSHVCAGVSLRARASAGRRHDGGAAAPAQPGRRTPLRVAGAGIAARQGDASGEGSAEGSAQALRARAAGGDRRPGHDRGRFGAAHRDPVAGPASPDGRRSAEGRLGRRRPAAAPADEFSRGGRTRRASSAPAGTCPRCGCSSASRRGASSPRPPAPRSSARASPRGISASCRNRSNSPARVRS